MTQACDRAFRNIPLAYEAACRRDTDESQGEDGEAKKYDRHLSAQPFQLIHIGVAGFEDDSTGKEEEAVLDERVENHMQQCARKGRAIKQEQAAQYVGNLGHRGKSKPFLQQAFVERHHGTHKNSDSCQGQKRYLHPCAAQKFNADAVVYDADNTNNACFGNNAGQYRTGGGGGHGVGCGQPAVHGEHACLGRKTHDSQEQHAQQRAWRNRQRFNIQRTPQNKVGACRVGDKKENSKQTHCCAGNRINKVFDRCRDGFFCALVQHQLQGKQRDRFKKQVHGDQCGCKAKRHQHAQRHHEERVIGFLVLLMGHIGEGEKRAGRPHGGHDQRKDDAQGIASQRDGQIFAQMQDHNGFFASQCNQNDYQALQRQCSPHKNGSRFSVQANLRDKSDHEPREHGEHQGNHHQETVHLFFLLFMKMNAGRQISTA